MLLCFKYFKSFETADKGRELGGGYQRANPSSFVFADWIPAEKRAGMTAYRVKYVQVISGEAETQRF